MLIWLFKIINYIIIGNDIWYKFLRPLPFEEAFEMLKKGYFIYSTTQRQKIYGLIGGTIFEINVAKDIVTRVDGFNKDAMVGRLWEVIPSREQAYFTGELDD